MNILVIDDWPERHAKICNAFAGADVHVLMEHRLNPDAVTVADLTKADVVFLDHDMCTAPKDQPCPRPVQRGSSFNLLNDGCGCPTGRDVVARMVALPSRPHCIVHSANEAGGRAMAQALFDADFSVVWSPVSTWGSLLPSSLMKLWKLRKQP